MIQIACIYMLGYLPFMSIEIHLHMYSIIWDSSRLSIDYMTECIANQNKILLYIWIDSYCNLKSGSTYRCMHIIYLQYNQGILHGQFVWRQTLRFPNQLFTLCAEESAAVKMLYPKGFRPSVHKVSSYILGCLGQVSDKRRGQQSSFRKFL